MNLPFDAQNLQEEENQRLAPFAIKNSMSAGREFDEAPDNFRLEFQRDRDRVIHSKSFRRLKGKTQVFVAHYGDHFRSRLTHTLEVAQISRSIARNLRVNEDLAETIALAHDLGHTPFGHAGEEAMSELLHRYGMNFEHNEQSRHIVEILEEKSPYYSGLNLTLETREGLWKHRTPHDRKYHRLSKQAFLEAQIVDLADEIAFQNHDLDDGIGSGILRIDDLQKLELWRKAEELYAQKINQKYKTHFIIGGLINLMTKDAIIETARRLQSINAQNPDDIRNYTEKTVAFSENIAEANHHLRHYLFSNLYKNETVIEQSNHGKAIIKKLFFHYHKNPDHLPKKFHNLINEGNAKEEVIKDFIAGMTDDFAIKENAKINLRAI